MAEIKLIVVAACLVATVKCDYNPSTTYGVPQNNFGGGHSGGGHNGGSESSHGFSFGEEGLGYGVGNRGGGYRDHYIGQGGHEQSQPYQFGYAVKDYHTGNDFKQQEHSDGNTVKGQYRVLLPDGRTQIVTYTADWQTGFHADVKYEGEALYPANYGHGGGGSTYGVPGVGGGGYGGGGYGGGSGGQGGYGGSSYNNIGGGSGGHFGGPSSSYGPPGYKK